MALPSGTARIRRIWYASQAQPLTPVFYDDALRGEAVLDPAVSENPQVRIAGAAFDSGFDFRHEVRVPVNGLLAYYNFNESSNWASSYGSANVFGTSLSAVGSGTVSSAVGKYGNAVQILGGQAVACTGTDIDLRGTDFTVAFWYKRTLSDDVSATNALWFGNTSAYQFFVNIDFNSVNFGIDDDNHTPFINNDNTFNTWFHVRFWYTRATQTAHMSINNNTPQTDSVGGSPGSLPAPSRIVLGTKYGNQFTLKSSLCIEGLGVWNRALTDAEATLVYSGGAGVDFPA